MKYGQFARVATISAAVVLLAAGCTQVERGVATWNADEASVPVQADAIGDIVISQDEVNDLVGADLEEKLAFDEPFDEQDYGECDQLQGKGLAAYLGDGWEQFEYNLSSDGTPEGGSDHVVIQSIALYSDAQAAQNAYDELTANIGDCDGNTLASDDAEWNQTVTDDPSDGVALWSAEQTDAIDTWVCSGQAQVRNNALLRVSVCQHDGEGAKPAAEIIDAMASAVWEQSSPN